MKEIKITILKCEQCGHEFIPRKIERKKCARCQSNKWNISRESRATKK